ncbi:MAG: hypothetical protein ACI81L_002364 [Verrucomicrobiales bacterium]|jgi:hypothetical protein
MPASPTSDCYLCGARNDPEAGFCVRCDGQLLKLPTDNVDLADEPLGHVFKGLPQSDKAVEARPKKRARKVSFEDQRPSDALGLEDDYNEMLDPKFVDTVVTSIPRATLSADIPLLGTRAGAVPQSAMNAGELGRRTYVLLALLLLATGAFGWSTLASSEEETPDNLAFTEATVPITTAITTSTKRAPRQWTKNEVDGAYGPTFVRIELLECAATSSAPVAEATGVGIAVDTHNAVIDPTPLRNVNAAVIRSRTGGRRLATVERNADGLHVATALIATSRNLDVELVEGDATHFVGYDPDTNAVSTNAAAQDVPAEIRITPTGDVHSIRLGSRVTNASHLANITGRVQNNPEVSLPDNPSLCQQVRNLVPIVPESDIEQTN